MVLLFVDFNALTIDVFCVQIKFAIKINNGVLKK
jgi:hypothetical protein